MGLKDDDFGLKNVRFNVSDTGMLLVIHLDTKFRVQEEPQFCEL